MYKNIYTYMCIYVYIYTHTHKYIYIYIYIYIFVYIFIYIYIYMKCCVYVYMYMCMWDKTWAESPLGKVPKCSRLRVVWRPGARRPDLPRPALAESGDTLRYLRPYGPRMPLRLWSYRYGLPRAVTFGGFESVPALRRGPLGDSWR